MKNGRDEKGGKKKARKVKGYTRYMEALNVERGLCNARLSFAGKGEISPTPW